MSINLSSFVGKFNVLVITLCAAFISACVPTSGPNDRIIDKEKALESFITLGMTYLQRGNRDASRQNFERALEIDKNSKQAHNGMGLLYQLTGEVDLAESSYKKALSVDGSYTEAIVNYGAFLYQQGRYQEASENFEKAATDLSYARRDLALAYAGRAAIKIGNKDRAKSAFEHSLNLNNSLALSMIEMAQISFEEQDYANAKMFLDRYDSVTRATPRSLLLGIRIERIFGNKDKEASYALALKNLHPYSKEYLEYKNLLKKPGSSP